MSSTRRTPAQLVKTALKDAGIDTKLISVVYHSYSMGSSIKITLKSFEIDRDAVEKVAQAYEDIRKCEATGEILGGGNQYVQVSYDWKLKTPTEIEAIAQDVIKNRPNFSRNNHIEVHHAANDCAEMNQGGRFKFTAQMFQSVLCKLEREAYP